MSTAIKRKQFNKVLNPDGTVAALVIHGHIIPLDDAKDVEKVDNSTIVYSSSNVSVATVVADPADPTKYILTWVAAGPVTIGIKANADLDPTGPVDDVSGSIDLLLLEDEATTISMVLDDVLPDTPASSSASSASAGTTQQ